MKQRLVRREDVIAVLNKLQQDHPVNVLGSDAARIYPVGSGTLFTKMVDYDDFVAELNDRVYKTTGRHDD